MLESRGDDLSNEPGRCKRKKIGVKKNLVFFQEKRSEQKKVASFLKRCEKRKVNRFLFFSQNLTKCLG